MYQQNQLVELRVDRFVRERLAPAVERSTAPVTIEAWAVPDEPVPFAQAVANAFEPFAVGQPWGRAWGTVWFRVTGTVPAEWEADPADVELVVDLGFLSGQAGFQAEGLVYATDGSILKALEPFNGYVRLRAAPGESFEVFVEAASNPDVGSDWSFRPTPVGRKSTASDQPIYSLRRVEVVHRDREVWELIQDVWTARGLAAVLPLESPRRASLFAALEDAVDAVDPVDVNATAAAGRAALAGVLSSPAAATRASRLRGRARPHRLGLAVAGARDDPQVRSHLLERARPHGPGSGLRLRLLVGPAVRVDEAVLPGAVRAHPGPGGRGPVRAGRRDVGRVGHEHARLRGDGAPVRRGQRVLPGGVRVRTARGLAARLVRLQRRAAADRPRRRRRLLSDAEDLVERGQQVSAPQLRVGGDRRHAHLHALPAGRHLQLAAVRRRARARRAQLRRQGSREHVARPVRVRRRRRRPDPRDARRRAPHGLPRGVADRAGRRTRATSSPRPRPSSTRPRCGRASSTSSSTAARTPRRPAPSRATGAASTCCTRPSCGRRRPRCAPGPSIRSAVLRDAWQTVLLQQFHDILPGSSIGWVHDQAEENYARVAEVLEGVIAESIAALGGRRRQRRSGGLQLVPVRDRRRARVRRRAGGGGHGCADRGRRRRVRSRERGPAHPGRRFRTDRVDRRRGPRAGSAPAGHPRQRAPGLPRHPGAVGRLGRRRRVPPLGRRPDGARQPRDRGRRARRRRRCGWSAASATRPSRRPSRCAPARRPSTSRPRSTGTSGSGCSSWPSRWTCTPHPRLSEIQFGHIERRDPHEHQLGHGTVRDPGAPLGARLRRRIRRRGRQRLDLRSRHHPARPRRRRNVLARAADAAAGAAVPRSRGRPGPARAAQRDRRRRGRRRHRAGLPAQPAGARCRRGDRGAAHRILDRRDRGRDRQARRGRLRGRDRAPLRGPRLAGHRNRSPPGSTTTASSRPICSNASSPRTRWFRRPATPSRSVCGPSSSSLCASRAGDVRPSAPGRANPGADDFYVSGWNSQSS